MQILKMAKDGLEHFASVLPAFGTVYAPVRRGKSHVFDRPSSWSDVDLSYRRTILPPRKLFLPPREVMFRYDARSGYDDLLTEAAEPRVLFGVHAYDIVALTILDRVFAQGPFTDPYYLTRRRSTAVIGIDGIPDENNFAASMHADTVDSGFDVYLSDIGDAYLLLIGTSRGHDIAAASECVLGKVTSADFAQYKRRSAALRAQYVTSVNISGFGHILEIEYDSEVWDHLAERCLSCGACSHVCPTCYCFDVRDEADLASGTGQRVRTWDSCLFRTHALVAGGENFRARRADRLKFRYYHKQRGFVAGYGRTSCVGCGRCIVACPAGIDVITVINALSFAGHPGLKDGGGRTDGDPERGAVAGADGEPVSAAPGADRSYPPDGAG